MVPWSSLVVLSTLLVITLSFPSPDDDQYKIPDVGTGRRSQYYILHDDGTYKYGYDSGDGAFESSKLHASGSLEGQFGYTDEEGNQIKLEYDSGAQGFVARGDHLPQPHPEILQAAANFRSAEPFVDPLASDNTDPSYNFGFNSETYERSENSNDEGIVTGSYSYVDEFGVKRSYTYRAGKGIGFVIEGDDIPQDISSSASQQGSNRQQLSSGSQSGVSQSNRHVAQSIKRTRPIVKSGPALHSSANSAHTFEPSNSDGSYSFSYKTDDHSRRESADSDLNVEGSFTFTSDDGVERTLNYVAGTATGFQATGDHIPVVDENFGAKLSAQTKTSLKTSGARTHKFAQRQETKQYQQHNRVGGQAVNQVRAQNNFQSQPPAIKTVSNSIDYTPADIRSSSSVDGTYSFSYDNSDHSRSESGDTSSVRGDFGFTADDDGQFRKITYEAGSDTGFIAEGSHIPIGPIVPGASSGQPTGRIEHVEEIEFVDPLADSDSDASYAFNFDSDTYSRSESSDADGNVVGTYSLVDENGAKKTYRFRAGKGIGFESELIEESQSGFSGSQSGFSASQSSSSASGTIASTSHQPSFKKADQNLFISSSSSRAHVSPSLNNRQSFSSNSVHKAPQVTLKTSGTGQKFHGSADDDEDLGYELHQYSDSDNSGKFGYVIKYD